MINKLKQHVKNIESQNRELQELVVELMLENKRLKDDVKIQTDKADKFIRNALDK